MTCGVWEANKPRRPGLDPGPLASSMEGPARITSVPGQARDDEWGWPTISLDNTNHIGYMPHTSRVRGSGTGSLAATPRAGACQGDHISGCGELPNVRQGMGATRPADASHRRARNQPSLSCQANHKRRPSRACVSFPGASPHSPAGVKLCPAQRSSPVGGGGPPAQPVVEGCPPPIRR